jgi:hypothetical protein
MDAQVILVDVNPKMVAAWREVFVDNPEVIIVHGSMTDQATSAWVTPTNSQGLHGRRPRRGDQEVPRADDPDEGAVGGRAALSRARCRWARHLRGDGRPEAALAHLDADHGGPLGRRLRHAQRGARLRGGLPDGADAERRAPGSIGSVALPGLGANTGQVPVEICADLMWTAYNLFREKEFSDYAEMRRALEEILGDLGEFGDKMKTDAGKADVKKKTTAIHAPTPAPLPDEDAGDFDDADDDEGDDEGESEDEDDDFDDH